MKFRTQTIWPRVALAFVWLLVWPAAAQTNRVLELNGAGDFVEMPRGVLGNLTAATIEMWVNWQGFEQPRKRAFNYGTPLRDVSLAAYDRGEAWFVFPESQKEFHQILTRPILTTQTWFHLAGTLGSGGMKLYVNGWLVDSDPFTGSFDKTLPEALFRIGEGVTPNDPPAAMRGWIDDVRVWNRERTVEEIRAGMHRKLTGREEGLVGLWNFDDGSAKDAGPNGWDGEFKGRAKAVAMEIPAEIGAGQNYLDLRVYEANGAAAKGTAAVLFEGTNVLAARYSGDGIFKMIVPAAKTQPILRVAHMTANVVVTNLELPPGEQRKLRIDLPRAEATAQSTNEFAALLCEVIIAHPTAIESFDPALLRELAPQLERAEPQMLSLFESGNVNHRRFIALFLEKFPRSSVAIFNALTKARNDSDQLVRGLAQNSLQSLAVPREFAPFYTKREIASGSLFAGLMVPFALIHFFLFVLNPAKKSNLYFGLFAAQGAGMIYLASGGSINGAAAQISGLAFMFLGLLVLYSLFYPRFPWTFWAATVLVLIGVCALSYESSEISEFSSIDLGSDRAQTHFPFGVIVAEAIGYFTFFLIIVDMLRVVLRGIFGRQEGAWLLGAGFLMLIATYITRVSLYVLLLAGKIAPDTFAKYIIYFPYSGAAGFVICGSIYLARSFSRTFAEVRTANAEIEKKNSELTLARDVAQTANTAKSQFLANMSHELRTPLNAIIGYSELVAEIAQEEGHKTYLSDLDKITTAAKHQLMLVNDILDLSKIEAGKMNVVIEEFDAREMVHEIKTVVAPLVAKKRNRLEIECPAELGKMTADQTKVRQILFNLLSNAAKFTEDGLITLRVVVNGDRTVSFAVSDTGIGMTAEQTTRLFQAFTQAEAGIHQKYGGTGLGLAISKRFCEMMGGDLTVKSEFGKGSTFTATLPIEVPQAVSP